jgi:uncharacterized protein (TIGR03083 family)
MAMGPIDTVPLFAPLHAELIALLRSLTPAQWLLPTVAGHWRVRDVAAHLLDGSLRKVAVYRDGHLLTPDAPITSPQDVGRLVNGLNAAGVSFADRLSTREIVDLLEIAGPWVANVISALPPHGPAIFAVSWAGEAASENWMDTGREYTEHWHHQMQIRDAVGAPLLLAPRWLDPLLDIAVRALPVAYAGVAAGDETAVVLEVALDDDASRAWTVFRVNGRWDIERGVHGSARCKVHTTADAAWRLLFNALSEREARSALTISGDASLAEPLMRARSIVL